MPISGNTPSRLKLRDRTLWISAVCFAAATILGVRFAFDHDQFEQVLPAALSVTFGLAFPRATEVTFDKAERICTVRWIDVLRVMRMRLAFVDIADLRSK